MAGSRGGEAGRGGGDDGSGDGVRWSRKHIDACRDHNGQELVWGYLLLVYMLDLSKR